MTKNLWAQFFQKKGYRAFAPSAQGAGVMSASPCLSHTHTRVNYDGYMKNIIVYRCVTLITKSLASIPFHVFVNQERQYEHPLLDLLSHINLYQSKATFFEAVTSYFLLTGNAYIEMVKDANGMPVELHILRPDRMNVVTDKTGIAVSYRLRINGLERDIPIKGENGAVLHIKSFHPLNDWFGMSPLEAAHLAISQHNTVSSHNISLLNNGGRPTGAIVVKTGPYGLDDQQRERLKEEIQTIYKGSSNAGKLVVLEGDFEWREMGLSPKDMDFIEGKNQAAREIAQAFGVPPMLVGVPGDATFANYREARYHLWEDTILPILDHLLAELTIWLEACYKENISIKADLDSIPALSLRRDAHWQKIASADFLSKEEKRHLLGFA